MSSLHNYSPGGSNRYSARKTIKPVNFLCIAPDAKKVSVIGDFNDWQPGAAPMKKQIDGAWTAQIHLGHGHHHYLFVIDEKPSLDPRAQGTARNEQGEKVSLVGVS